MGGGSGGGGLAVNATSILCWAILPNLFTNALVSLFYRLSPSSRPTIPPNASPQHLANAQQRAQSHHRRARIALVLGYLAYSVLSIYFAQSTGLEQNYYSLLGLSREAIEHDPSGVVKGHWRRLARRYHPDKVGKQGEAFFVRLRTGVEILENDHKRWAYERFGPEIHEWGSKLVTPRELLVTGSLRSLAWWAFALASVFAFTFFRKSERQYNFWRYLSLFLCLSLELHLITRSTESATFSRLFPNRLTYEHVSLLRQIFISTSMAMSQLAPVLFPPAPDVSAPASEEDQVAVALRDADQLKPLIARLTRLAATAEAELLALQQLELEPLIATPGSDVRSVRRELRQHMVRTFEDLQLKGSAETKAFWSEAVRAGLESEAAQAQEKPRARSRPAREGLSETSETGADQERPGSKQQEIAPAVKAPRESKPGPSLVSPPPSPKSTAATLEPTHESGRPREASTKADFLVAPAPADRFSSRLPTPPPDL